MTTPNAMPVKRPAPPAPRKVRTPRPIRNTALADQLRAKGYVK